MRIYDIFYEECVLVTCVCGQGNEDIQILCIQRVKKQKKSPNLSLEIACYPFVLIEATKRWSRRGLEKERKRECGAKSHNILKVLRQLSSSRKKKLTAVGGREWQKSPHKNILLPSIQTPGKLVCNEIQIIVKMRNGEVLNHVAYFGSSPAVFR